VKSKNELVDALCQIRQRDEMTHFLQEILTENEMEDVIFRWRLMKDLHKGETQRHIAKKHGISLCKITRGSKILKEEDSMSLKLIKELED
jgi:TrpR family transcriptional regulator, trp operon repressor